MENFDWLGETTIERVGKYKGVPFRMKDGNLIFPRDGYNLMWELMLRGYYTFQGVNGEPDIIMGPIRYIDRNATWKD